MGDCIQGLTIQESNWPTTQNCAQTLLASSRSREPRRPPLSSKNRYVGQSCRPEVLFGRSEGLLSLLLFFHCHSKSWQYPAGQDIVAASPLDQNPWFVAHLISQDLKPARQNRTWPQISQLLSFASWQVESSMIQTVLNGKDYMADNIYFVFIFIYLLDVFAAPLVSK